MSDYVLSCSSTADYPRSFFEERHVLLTCFHYNMDGGTYPDDLYARITPHEFFSKIKAGSQPTTSQIAAGEYVATWEPELKAGHDILHVTLSSGISGTYNSACVAAEQLRSAYPERTINVVDSLCASSGYGLLVEWFYVSDLECLKRGGRVSKTSALIATALKICPLLNMDYQGKLIPREKIRTKMKAQKRLVRAMMAHVEDGAAYTGKCCISQSDCREDAEEVARMIGEQIPQLVGKIAIHDIGTVIGAHTGPGTVALFFMGDKRVD